ncbi:MFS transporter [Niabella hibiscisoli]|uniref:MFS transporter n=1 Tax=Niabella hibiscisoli TaxID=1825928 RepID=UPI001F0D2C22|nr:MFS transporter [Niabella hibiscisoli]MCH5719372.1 MFS transporter [Niabella hibiscisoli]
MANAFGNYVLLPVFYTGRHNFGWAAKSLIAELGISYAQLGWISFSMLMGYAIGQLINGNLADYFSSRKMILAGGLLSVAANIAISFSHTYTMILLLWCLNGYFQSLAWAPGTRIISNWWRREERGKAFGLYTMAAGLSSVVTFLLSILIVQQDAEWPSLFRIPVLFLLGAVLIFFFLTADKPSDRGFANLYQESTIGHSSNWKERYRVVFGNRRFMMASLAMGFESMARYGLIVWVPVHYLGNNWKENPHYLWATLLMPIGMSLGALTFGSISDKLLKGNSVAAIRMGMLISAVLALLIFSLSVENLIVSGSLMFLAGFFVYGLQSNFWPMSPEILGEKYVATGVGVMNTAAYIFAALGEPLLGFIIDLTGNTSYVFLAITVICLLCALTISAVRKPRMKVPLSIVG